MNVEKCFFDDLYSYGFYFNSKSRRMEVYFDEYATEEAHVKKSCKIVVQNWTKALSKLASEDEFVDLEKNLGAVSMLLKSKKNGDLFEMTVNTVDGRYVDYIFNSATVWIEEI